MSLTDASSRDLRRYYRALGDDTRLRILQTCRSSR